MRSPAWDGYLADPFVLRHRDRFYAYGTSNPAERTGGFEALVSDDLTSWTSLGQVLSGVPADLGDDFWAPEVVAADGALWLYYSVGHGIDGHHIRAARADDPAGPFLDQGVNLTPDESFAIDAHPFLDVDGSWYLFYARDVIEAPRPGTQLAVRRLTSMTTVADDVTTVLEPDSDWQLFERGRELYGRRLDWHTLEGATVLRRGDRYVLFFSGGRWEGAGYGVSFATAPHPLGPWTHVPAEAADVLNTEIVGLPGPGHNSILSTAEGIDLIVYHAWNPDGTKRQLYLEQLEWDGGTPHVPAAPELARG